MNYALNHTRTFRPLRGGIQITNPVVAMPGTLGFIAGDSSGNQWLVSCFHVLCRADDQDFAENEPIHQPIEDGDSTLIAHVTHDRADRSLDCAAARIAPGVGAVHEILGLAAINGAAVAEVGRRVIKSGVATGITDGIIESVSDSEIRIELPAAYPGDYKHCDRMDSGAVWVDRETLSPIALHNGGNLTDHFYATAAPILSVLDTLDLRLD